MKDEGLCVLRPMDLGDGDWHQPGCALVLPRVFDSLSTCGHNVRLRSAKTG